MEPKIVFDNDNDEREWKKDKLVLMSSYFKHYGVYDYCQDTYYKEVNKGEYVEILESELDICVVEPARHILCFIGNGSTDRFQHCSPASNGYPEYPWGGRQFEHVYIMSSGVKLDDWTGRYGFIECHEKVKDFSIEYKLNAKLKDLVDIQ